MEAVQGKKKAAMHTQKKKGGGGGLSWLQRKKISYFVRALSATAQKIFLFWNGHTGRVNFFLFKPWLQLK
jgi:hypothetical protein